LHDLLLKDTHFLPHFPGFPARKALQNSTAQRGVDYKKSRPNGLFLRKFYQGKKVSGKGGFTQRRKGGA
jgi:hypothetical protein